MLQKLNSLAKQNAIKAVEDTMFVSAWFLLRTAGSTSLSGPRVPIKNPKLLKLLSIIVSLSMNMLCRVLKKLAEI